MKTQGQSEGLICNGVTQIMLGFLGRGPKTIKCHIFEEMIYSRIWNKYSSAEDSLILTEIGSEILKNYRINSMLSVHSVFEKLIIDTFSIKLINFHHDITVVNGEEVLIFTLESIPKFK